MLFYFINMNMIMINIINIINLTWDEYMFDKFTDAYLQIISEEYEPLIKKGKITKQSVLDTNKKDAENPLFGKTYAEFEKIAKQISRNRNGYDAGDKVTCPVCGEKLIKNTNRQWGHVKDELRITKDGTNLKVRNCSKVWDDSLKAWNKQYPDDNGEAVNVLKKLAKWELIGTKHGTYSPINKDKYCGRALPIYRSGWELKAFIGLDKNPKVKKWGSETLSIPYSDKTRGRRSSLLYPWFIFFSNRYKWYWAKVVNRN